MALHDMTSRNSLFGIKALSNINLKVLKSQDKDNLDGKSDEVLNNNKCNRNLEDNRFHTS